MYGFWVIRAYGLWGIADVWVMDQVSLHTTLVTKNSYGLLHIMGYESYGLRGL